jgi:uncharacterized protein (TIGR02001 family)
LNSAPSDATNAAFQGDSVKKIAIFVLIFSPVAYAAESSSTVPGTISTSETSQSSTSETESGSGTVTGNLALGSDYIFRGQTLTNHGLSGQGEVDYTHPSGVYLGAWGANVSFPDSNAKAEFDWYGGYTYNVTSSLSASLGALYYSYYRANDINTLEFPFQLTLNDFKAGLAYSPHWGGSDNGHAYYLSTGWSKKIHWETTLALNVGYSMFDPDLGFKDYADFHAGLSREFYKLNWDLSGYFVNAEQFNGADDPRVVLTVSKAL